MIKNGSREGNTTSHHMFNPLMEASKASSGKTINEMVKIVTLMAKTAVFILEGAKLCTSYLKFRSVILNERDGK
jgi:hypothetical protein